MPLDLSPPVPTINVRAAVSPEEWEMRVELAALYRLAARHGMTDLGGTHFSARVPNAPGSDEHHFLINPYGLMFQEVTASNLVKIDIDGEIVLDNGFPVNPAGFTIHSAIHMAREDIVCVAHTHTVAGMAVSCLKEGLLPVTQHSLRFHGRLSYHDWEGVATNLDERERLVRDLGENYTMILRNHGVLCCGRSMPEAWRGLFALEKSCASQLEAMKISNATGRPIKLPPEAVAQGTSDKLESRHGKDMVSRDWPGQLAKLDREEPDYAH